MYDVVAVDDEAVIRGLLGRIFRILDWQAAIVDSPIRALEVLEQDGARILLTDINMPVMNGAELARKARELFPEMPIIALTASVHETDLNPADFTCVLSKPFGVSRLLAILTEQIVESKRHA
jgi:CheY-like chemotaxis protein